MVRAGSAVDKGKFGPLGRRFRVEVDVEGPPATTLAMLAFSAEEAAAWEAALNGAPSAGGATFSSTPRGGGARNETIPKEERRVPTSRTSRTPAPRSNAGRFEEESVL